MFYPLTGSQIFGFSPNNLRCYTSTTLLQHKKTLFAFATDNNIIIFDRLTLKSQIITIPDITSNVIAIAFTGNGDYTSIFCGLESGKLFSYLLSDISKPIMEETLGFTLTSMTASNDYLFCKAGSLLYAIPITHNSIDLQGKIILSETLVHDKCIVSPCGRCLASYTKGAKCPVFWYAPFERRRRSNLPIDGHISDFQWGSSDRLLGVTATLEGIVRIWEESTTSYELRCVKWYDYGFRVLSAAIVTSADVENQIELKSCQKAASDSGRVFPAVKRQKVLIMAVVQDDKSTVCILQEKKRPQLFPIGRLVISLESPIATFCDMKRVFSEGELKRLISMVRFSPSSLAFDQFELGKNSMTHTTPLNIPFILSPISSIQKQANVITHHQDGSLFNWWKLSRILEKCENLEMSEFKEGNIIVLPNEIKFEISSTKYLQKYQFSNSVSFATIIKYDKCAMIAAVNSKEVYIVMLKAKEESKDHINYKMERIPVSNASENISSITIHSTDLFALSTDKSVDAYFFSDDSYKKLTSLESETPCSLFIPHPMALIAVSSKINLKFYIVWSNRFIPIEEFDENLKNDYPYPLFKTMNITEDGSIIAATEHCLYDLEFYATDFPIPYPLGNDLVMNTSFTLCYFYILSELLNGRKITTDSYKVKMLSENFAFPKEPPKGTASAIEETCQKPPPSWGNLDENGMRFLFSYKFAKSNDVSDLNHLVPFFSVWALLSSDQSGLITSLNPTSSKMIYDMKVGIWVKDFTVITKALTYLVEETIPTDSEFDTYLLFAVLLNKKSAAKKIARIKHQSKLEKFFSENDIRNDQKLLNKIEKSAFEAQKLHRNPLAAMFFVLKGMNKQALIVLREDKPLYLIVLRFFSENDWFESIPDDYVNGFFTKWWRFYMKQKEILAKFEGRINSTNASQLDALKKDAVDALKNWEFQKSEKISIEMHKFEMLKKFNASLPCDLLSLQLTPGFIEMQALEQTSELVLASQTEESKSKNIPEQKNNEEEENVKDDSVDDSLALFDFGGAGGDWGIESDFSSDGEEEEEEKEKDAKNKEKLENESIEKEKIIVKKLFDSNFHDVCQLHPFNSPGPICFTFDEKFLVFLISSLFNDTYNASTIRLITHVSDVLYQKAKKDALTATKEKKTSEPPSKSKIPLPPSASPVQQRSKSTNSAIASTAGQLPLLPSSVSQQQQQQQQQNVIPLNIRKETSIIISILYSLTYALSKANLMMVLFSNPLSLESLGPLVDEFVNRKYKIKQRNQANILKKFVEKNVEVDENDRQLANFISFNEICKVLIRQGKLSQIQMLISFFHHRNRLLFSDLHSFCFTQKNYILDLETIGLQCGDIFQQIRLNMMNRKWHVTMVNQFISPFYFGDHFQCSKSFEKRSTRYKTEELSSSSSTDSFESEEFYNSYSNSNNTINNDNTYKKSSNVYEPPAIKSKSAFSIEEGEQRKKLITTSSSSLNIYSSSVLSKISPPSILAVCVNPRNSTDVAIGGKFGVEFIDISKQDSLSSSASNPDLSFNSQPSLIDLVDSFVDTDEQFFKNLGHDSGMTKSISSNLSKENKKSRLFTPNNLKNINNELNNLDNNDKFNTEKNSILRSVSVENQKKIDLRQTYTHPYDSPFVSMMGQAKVKSPDKKSSERKGFFYQKREFNPLWPKDKVSLKDLEVTCMASHPREAYFTIGTDSGRLYMAAFGQKSTISSVLYTESPVSSLELNDTGDRLLTTSENGHIYVSNFKTANLYVSVQGASAAWLNNDTQFIVCEPMNKQFAIYDIIAGLSPVAIYQIPQSIRLNSFPKDYYSFSSVPISPKPKSKVFASKKYKKKVMYSQAKRIPIAVCGHQILTGHEDGTVVQFDLRSQDFICHKLHKTPVTTIKIDRSERFFISGSSDNTMKIVNIMVASTPQALRDVFTSYDQIPDDEPKGVTDIAITDQTIVAVGHSSTIHAWTVNEPHGLM